LTSHAAEYIGIAAPHASPRKTGYS